MGEKVLVIEDDLILRKAITVALKDAGFNVVEAVDGVEALLKVETVKPDIILLDLLLPKKTGWRVLEEIRNHKNESIKKLPIIVLTAVGEEKSLKECLKQGVDDYLIKSDYSLDSVVEKIKNSLI